MSFLSRVAQLIGASSRKLKVAGHMLGLRVWSQRGACRKQQIDISLPPFPPFLSL